MRILCLSAAVLAVLTSAVARAEFWGYDGAREGFLDRVWEAGLPDFGEAGYGAAVGPLFSAFEQETGRSLRPGKHRRVALKVYTNSGVGLATPVPLVAAVVAELERRGYRRDEIFLLDLRATWLRDAGFLPPLSERALGDTFRGVPVEVLEEGHLYRDAWFYDNPLPPQRPGFGAGGLVDEDRSPEASGRDRQSFLPAPLVEGVDFWINLPVAFDHPAVAVNGAIANATIWNVSNHARFLLSPANAPIAAAEIAAIPELASHLAFHLVSLERYQFIGGPVFASLYTRSEPRLWLAVNPVVVDAALLERMNRARVEDGFKPLPREPQILTFGEAIGLGTRDPAKVRWIPVGP